MIGITFFIMLLCLGSSSTKRRCCGHTAACMDIFPDKALESDRMANVTINYQPTQKQAMFHASKANEILYGGAAGGGKRRRSSWTRCFAA